MSMASPARFAVVDGSGLKLQRHVGKPCRDAAIAASVRIVTTRPGDLHAVDSRERIEDLAQRFALVAEEGKRFSATRDSNEGGVLHLAEPFEGRQRRADSGPATRR